MGVSRDRLWPERVLWTLSLLGAVTYGLVIGARTEDGNRLCYTSFLFVLVWFVSLLFIDVNERSRTRLNRIRFMIQAWLFIAIPVLLLSSWGYFLTTLLLR